MHAPSPLPAWDCIRPINSITLEWRRFHLLAFLSMVACGGSGGGGDSVPSPPPVQVNYSDTLSVDRGSFVDIPLHNTVAGDGVTPNPVPVNGTLTLAADARSVRYQSNGIGVGEERFTLTARHQQTNVEFHDVRLMVRRTDARPNILFVLTDDQDVGIIATVAPLAVQDMSGRLAALKTCAGAGCRTEESRP